MIKQTFLWIMAWFYVPHGGKFYQYQRGKVKTRCSLCSGGHRRNMVGLDGESKGKAFCIRCYIDKIPGEAEKVMLKLVRPLSIMVLALMMVSSASTWMAFSRSKVIFRSAVSQRQIENVVEWAYKRSKNVSRETIRKMVETVNDESPNMVFFVLGCALLDTESQWDPGHRGMMRNKKRKLVPSGARGPGAVVASQHPEEMERAGCRDEKDLHDPVIGTKTAMECFKVYLKKAKGNTSTALKYYLQGEGTKYAGVDWNMTPEKYFTVTANTQGEIMLVLDSKTADTP